MNPHTLEIREAIAEATTDALLMPDLHKATRYLTPKLTIKATRQHRATSRTTRHTILVTVGTPNYFERRIIKASLKAGTCFPLKSTYHEFYSKPKRVK